MRFIVGALGLVLTASCSHTGPTASPSAPGIPDSAIGLSKAAITEVPDPLAFRSVDSDPGDVPLPARAFHGAPPVISHTLEDMVPITPSENACVDCHEVGSKEPGEPTPIPDSHFVDLRSNPDTRGDTVAGARYNCILCHAAQTDATPLVGTTFVP